MPPYENHHFHQFHPHHQVTGGAQGLGYAIADRLASDGYKVVLVDVNEKKLAEAQAEITSKVGKNRVSFVAVDVTKEDDIFAAVKSVVAAHGRIDVLVQAAGIVGKTGIKTHEVSEDNFNLVININLKGIFLMCKAVLPHMVEQKFGRIINIASVAGVHLQFKNSRYLDNQPGVVIS